MNPTKQPEPDSARDNKFPVDLSAAIDRLWDRFLPEIRQRVEILEAAAAALAVNQLPAEREAVHAAAHKLAGTLGTFNLSRGTDLAREFERLYSHHNTNDHFPASQLVAIASELRVIIDSRK